MTCKICVEHYRDTLNLQRSSKKHLLKLSGFILPLEKKNKNSEWFFIIIEPFCGTVMNFRKKISCNTDAVRVIESQKQALTQQTTAHKTVMALKEHTRKYVELKFRNVHALIKLEAQWAWPPQAILVSEWQICLNLLL
jgi:hypothetical protein